MATEFKKYVCFYQANRDIVLIITPDSVMSDDRIGFKWVHDNISGTYSIQPKISGNFSALVNANWLFAEHRAFHSENRILKLFRPELERIELSIFEIRALGFDKYKL